ncbi:hypothetical protein [Haliscomenobacter sp.]|uniref:hypothetical protein n=1 Tax=Haliscomenobacter sp. TaxID=2717303 RepID=UPI00359446BA
MPKLLMCLLSVVLLGSKSCSSKALGDFVNLLKTSDKVELFAVEAFPTAAQEQTLDATYVADYKVSEFIPTDPVEATALTLASIEVKNFDLINVKNCPFMAKYALRFSKGKDRITMVISSSPCGKARMLFASGAKERSLELTPENSLEAAIQKIVSKQAIVK